MICEMYLNKAVKKKNHQNSSGYLGPPRWYCIASTLSQGPLERLHGAVERGRAEGS